MNRLGRYDVDAAFDRMSLQTVDEFGLDAILAVFRVVADGRQHGRQRSRMACRAGARALISEATRRQES